MTSLASQKTNAAFLSILVFLMTVVFVVSSTKNDDVNSSDESHELTRNKRLLFKDKSKHWVKGIVPFKFNDDLHQWEKDEIFKSIALYHKYTPIRFVTYNSSTIQLYGINPGYVLFRHVTVATGCQAITGHLTRAMDTYCCRINSCVHELGHVLGFKHEQSSWKRNKWISLNKKATDSSEYEMLDKNLFLDVPYDVYSYMQYSPKTGEYSMNFPELTFRWKRAYYYMFKELCMVYKCEEYSQCQDNNLNCVNDGYISVVDDKCTCMCPEGFDPATGCATPINKACGEVITLNRNNPTTVISSNRANHDNTNCYWIVKGDPNEAGTLLLHLDEMDVKYLNSRCYDKIHVTHTRLAHQGVLYCGSEEKTTIRSVYKGLRIQFETEVKSKSYFTASVTWKPASDLCYGPGDDVGESYAGSVNYSREFKPCMNWIDAKGKCPYHPFKNGQILFQLTDNSCRNPDKGFHPWCYVDLDTCEKRYCDVCSLEQPYDISDSSTCSLFKQDGKCTTQPTQALNCAKTCDVQMKIDNKVKCRPNTLTGSRLRQAKSFYNVGEKAIYECLKDTSATIQVSCLPDGTWSQGNTACTECPIGWTPYNGQCYFYDPEDKSHFQNAKSKCNELGGTIATFKNKAIETFLTTLSDGNQLWIGLENQGTALKWLDGTEVVYTNWASAGGPADVLKRRPSSTVYASKIKQWMYTFVDTYAHHFVCETKAISNPECVDFLDNCNFYLKQTTCESSPSLKNLCRKSCNRCGVTAPTTTCTASSLPARSGVSIPNPSQLFNVGATTSLYCSANSVSDIEEYTCLKTGKWSVTKSECSMSDGCLSGATEFNGKCYTYKSKPQRWYPASLDCQKLTNGVIANAKTQEENEFLKQFVVPSSNGRMLIGNYYTYTPHRGWQWSDMTFDTWTNWNPNSNVKRTPLNRCSVMLSDGTWEISSCGDQVPFVCQSDKTAA